MTTTVDDPRPELREIEEALGHACHAAKREVPKVGTDEHPTPWDKAHQHLDQRLTEWELARA